MQTNLLSRRAVLATAAGNALFPLAGRAQASWPDRPIKLIIPFAAGGGTDIIGRTLAARLGAQLGQAVVIDNKGGAGGAIGYDAAAKAAPDGYTLLLMTMAFATNAASGRKLTYNPTRDFVPVGEIGSTPLAIVVATDSPIKSLRDLVEQARANPNTLTYASNGAGSMSHLGAALLASEAKVQLTHVAYKGMPPALTDVMADRVNVAVTSFASVSSLMKGGKLRGLAVTSTQRTTAAPELPTTAEAGLPSFNIDFWYGLLAPAKVPPAIVKRLNTELNSVLGQAEMREMLGREAGVPAPGTPEDFGRLMSAELARWGQLIKDNGISFE
jgi:tripartite-type tricarboxylate transporter receptor subunit TctC